MKKIRRIMAVLVLLIVTSSVCRVQAKTVGEDYSDTFGGCYLEKDKLVILLTDISPEVQEMYKSACGNYSKVEFREAEYSYEYLLGLRRYSRKLYRLFECEG